MSSATSPSPAPPRAALTLVMSGVLLSTMDSGMVNVALPTIMRDLRVDLDSAGLVVTAYLLTVTVTLVFWGRLADRIGRGRVYLLGVLVFAGGALACFTSENFVLLLLSRGLQALGAAMMMATGPAIIRQAYPVVNLGRSIGMVGIATAAGLLIGPMLGGLLVDLWSWRGVFLVPVPLSAVAFLLGQRFLRTVLEQGQGGAAGPFDWLGSCCWTLLVLAAVLLLQRPVSTTVLLLPPFALLLWFFLRTEARAKAPILPLPLITRRYYWIAVVTATLSFAVLFAVLVLIPFYLEYILAETALVVGQVMLAVPATLVVVSPWSGRLYDRIGARFPASAGLALCALALAGLTATLSLTTPLWLVAGHLALLGAGQAIFLTPNSASVLAQVEEEALGITAGILATARNLGMVSGATLAVALCSYTFAQQSGGLSLGEYHPGVAAALLAALRTAFAVASLIATIAALVSLGRQR